MRGSIRLFRVQGISINIHITFFLIVFYFMLFGIKGVALILGVFCFVTLHELCHGLVAQKFGIRVKEITLLPIGGVASMTKMPEKPSEEFYISLAGPLLNLAVIIIFYIPLSALWGSEMLHGFFSYGVSLKSWPHVIISIYWINLILAVFNLIPAFPMDGGRILRSLLVPRLGYRKATKVAVNMGHIIAPILGVLGWFSGNWILILIAIFIYFTASSEETQVDIKETLKKFNVKDVISSRFITVHKEATLSKILELIFHSHQEDFPVLEKGRMAGFITRSDIIHGIHQRGTSAHVSEVMRDKFPALDESDSLDKAQNIMQENGMRALPVMKRGGLIGVVTIEDISRVYSVMTNRR